MMFGLPPKNDFSAEDASLRFQNINWDVEVYMSTTGSDFNDGLTPQTPKLTLQGVLYNNGTNDRGPVAAAHAAGQSVRVNIESGTYNISGSRFNYTATGWGFQDRWLCIEGESPGSVIFDASSPLTNWTNTGTNTWQHPWTKNWPAQVDPWNGSAGTAQAILYREMIWYGDIIPRQVFSLSDLNLYTEAYYVDNIGQTITLKTYTIDPTVTEVRHADMTEFLYVYGKNNFIIRNLRFTGFATYTGTTECNVITFTRPSAGVFPTNILLENCKFDHINGNAVEFRYCTDVTVKFCYFSDIGWRALRIGYNDDAPNENGSVIEDCFATRINFRGIWDNILSWDASFIKNTHAKNQIVRRNCIWNCYTNGIWWDIDNVNCSSTDNFISYNLGVGTYFEISMGPLKSINNFFWGNNTGVLFGEVNWAESINNFHLDDKQAIQIRNNGRAIYRNYVFSKLKCQNNTIISNGQSHKVIYGPVGSSSTVAKEQLPDENLVYPALELGYNKYKYTSNLPFTNNNTPVDKTTWDTTISSGTYGPPRISDSTSTDITYEGYGLESQYSYNEYSLASTEMSSFDSLIGSLTPNINKTNATVYPRSFNITGIDHTFDLLVPLTGKYDFSFFAKSGRITVDGKSYSNSFSIILTAGQIINIHIRLITDKKNAIVSFITPISKKQHPIPSCFLYTERIINEPWYHIPSNISNDETNIFYVKDTSVRRNFMDWGSWIGYTPTKIAYGTSSTSIIGARVTRDIIPQIKHTESKTIYGAFPFYVGNIADGQGYTNVLLMHYNASYTSTNANDSIMIQFNGATRTFAIRTSSFGGALTDDTRYMVLFKAVFPGNSTVLLSASVLPLGSDVSSEPTWQVQNTSRTLTSDLSLVSYRINNTSKVGEIRLSSTYSGLFT